MTSVLALSHQLSALSDDDLELVLEARDISPGGIKNFLNLAESLLAPESLDRVLSRLDRNALAAVAILFSAHPDEPPLSLGEIQEIITTANPQHKLPFDWARRTVGSLNTLALVRLTDTGVQIWPEVTQALTLLQERGAPSLLELTHLAPPSALEAVPIEPVENADRHAAEAAFSLLRTTRDLVIELQDSPAPVRSRGGLTLPASKRLSETLQIDIDDLPLTMKLAERAQLIVETAESWVTRPEADAWLLLSPAERWVTLVSAWAASLPPNILETLAQHPRHIWDDALDTLVPWLFPASADFANAQAQSIRAESRYIGALSGSAGSSFTRALLSEGPTAAAATLAPLLPTEVSQVYIQPDLTIVSPGPLRAALDQQLRGIATIESRGLAPTYRITETSLFRALNRGLHEEEIRSFLRNLSLTEIPQPLDYLITEAVRRFGSIKVSTLPSEASSVSPLTAITASDPQQLETLLVDRGLQHLSLKRHDQDTLISTMSARVVLLSLHEAKYPAAPGENELVAAKNDAPTTPFPGPSPARQANPSITHLRERLRNNQHSHESDPAAGGLTHQLTTAIKTKSRITVSLVAPNGTTHKYTILPTSLSTQRLRGLDELSDVERTLPLAWITGIEPAES
ncbi:helicase-associated domain-containing protein [Lysinibacter sp. HNR]|uniref:helicase-associated domain-containing protein n=1 Tax=Lysinibacter sp. HNR TaxID=3031408 RepID=UPI002435EB2C|nr:helicase-associated domain-containing protein [Lysinibacter sp. HNR]WGD36988.1 helicase-associated domain-containing protein [Lysinibacter sp. HNR]